jgi:hypothetical protein
MIVSLIYVKGEDFTTTEDSEKNEIIYKGYLHTHS